MLKRPIKPLIALAAASLLTLPIVSCKEKTPAEKVGDAVEDAADEIGDAVEDAVD